MANEIESNGSIGAANLLTANVQMTGQASSSSDFDYFKLYNSGSGTSQFTVNLPNTYSNYYIKIYDNTGTLQKSYTAYNGSVTYTVPSTSVGYSYISINSGSTDDYSITANFIASSSAGSNTEIESNGSIGAANLLTANVQMTGQASSSSDFDYFKLYNSGSGTSQFTVNLPNTYSNYYIKIYDNTGTLQKSYTAYNGSVTYTVPSTSVGYSYISINSGSTDDYSITANFIASSSAGSNTEIESNGSIGAANLLTANVQMTGQASSSSDFDYFKLYNSGSGTSQFTVNLPNTYSNYYIKIYDNTGTLQKSYTAYNGSVTYTVPSTSVGYSYISINSGSTDDYSITANFIASSSAGSNTEIESNGSIGAANLLTANVQMTGQASSSSDFDYFKLYNSGSGTSQFTVNLPNTYSNYYIKIYDNTGTLQKSYTAYNGSVTYTVPSTSVGYSYISINSGSTDDYSITANFIADKITITPSYQLTTNLISINEGSIASFTLTTTNVASGTSVPYTLLGISAADVSGGSLSGNAVINSSGVATISVTLLNDSLTEGSETLTVSAGGASASAVVNDTSVNSFTPNSNIPAKISLGNIAGKTLNLVNPIQFENGKIYYYLDANGDGKNSIISGNISTYYLDAISHDYLDTLLNAGADTVDTQPNGAKWGVDDERTLKLGSIYIVLPTSSEVKVDFSLGAYFWSGGTRYSTSDSVAVSNGTQSIWPTVGWDSANPFWLATPSVYGHNYFNASGGTSGSNSIAGVDSFRDIFAVFQVLFDGVNYPSSVSQQATATYFVSSSSYSVNEGSLASFTLTTTNVAAGTSVPYTISGISAADVSGGSLSGTTTVASNGQATITVLLANDNLTEGTETLTVTAGGASASTQINDTSKAASATYAVSTNWTSTTEGTPIVATLSTTNVAAGTTLYYQLSGSGITTSDFGGLSLSGSSVINSLGQASLTIPLSADVTTEGNETFVIQYYTDSGRSTAAGSATYVTIQDTSKGAVTPTYAVSANSSSVNEGSTADFTITTSNVNAGTSIAYTLSGVTSSDITGGALTGFATVNSVGTATVSVPIAADNLTEGAETLTISLQGKTASILINDTSKAAAVPTYSLAASSATVSEGSVATFTLTTTGVTPGTSVSYTITGVNASDVTGGLSGVATIDTNGLATISVPVAADFLTEGAETLTVTAQGKSASIEVSDTSKTTLVASYALSASTNSVSEGSSAVFTLTTTNVAGGTSITYTISGVSSADITGGALSGTAIVSSNGNATITIPIASDLTTEGTESLTVTAQGINASVTISDTSITQVVVNPISTVTSTPYGNGKYFYGSAGADKVTGTSFVDVVKQSSTVSSNQLTKLSDGSWQVQNKITPSNSDNLVNVERVEFSDMSVALDVSGPAGQVAKILGSVFGKSYVSNAEFAGIGFAYLDGGMSYLDLCGLAAGAAVLSTPDLLVTTLLRNTTGTEPTALSKSSYLQSISSGASYASVVQQIADSSANAQSIKLTDLANTGLAYTPYVLPPTYSLSASTASVNEGSTAVFNLTATNVAVGTEVSYTLSGVGTSDLTSGTLTGKVTIGAGGAASISVPIAADGATEGQESLTISAQGTTASIVINDTSKSAAIPTYSLIAGSSSIDEGASVLVIVNTANVAPGTSLEYGISGINITTDDLLGGLKGIAVVDSFGTALINLLTLADLTTEGSETMVITMGKSDTQIVINDTSITLVGITDGGEGDGGGGGGGSGE